MPDRVRVVVIGTGGIGNYHIGQWREVPEAEVVGVYDVRPEIAARVAEAHGIRKTYRSLAEAVAEPAADAVDVCTPNMYHRECTVAALGAGKHVLCEKPLAARATDIEQMIAARDSSDRVLMTAQHLRFEQRTQTLRRFIAAGRLGQAYYGRAWWLRRRFAPATPGFLSRRQAGFGPGMDLGVHVLDLALYLMGHPIPASVTGVAGAKLAHRPDVCNQWGTFQPDDFEVEDFAAAFVRFAGGAALTIEVSWLLNMLDAETFGVDLHGTEGGVRWPELKIAHVQDGALVDTHITTGTGTNGHKAALAAFADAIRTGGPSPVPAEQSLAVARVLDAVYVSAETGREVQLQTDERVEK